MSYKVKPKDISCEFAEVAKELFKEGYWSHNTRHHAADFLNAAIEAGLVSPPCHVLTRDGGYVIDPGYDGAIRVWPGKACGPNVEHYWGQKA